MPDLRTENLLLLKEVGAACQNLPSRAKVVVWSFLRNPCQLLVFGRSGSLQVISLQSGQTQKLLPAILDKYGHLISFGDEDVDIMSEASSGGQLDQNTPSSLQALLQKEGLSMLDCMDYFVHCLSLASDALSCVRVCTSVDAVVRDWQDVLLSTQTIDGRGFRVSARGGSTSATMRSRLLPDEPSFKLPSFWCKYEDGKFQFLLPHSKSWDDDIPSDQELVASDRSALLILPGVIASSVCTGLGFLLVRFKDCEAVMSVDLSDGTLKIVERSSPPYSVTGLCVVGCHVIVGKRSRHGDMKIKMYRCSKSGCLNVCDQVRLPNMCYEDGCFPSLTVHGNDILVSRRAPLDYHNPRPSEVVLLQISPAAEDMCKLSVSCKRQVNWESWTCPEEDFTGLAVPAGSGIIAFPSGEMYMDYSNPYNNIFSFGSECFRSYIQLVRLFGEDGNSFDHDFIEVVGPQLRIDVEKHHGIRAIVPWARPFGCSFSELLASCVGALATMHHDTDSDRSSVTQFVEHPDPPASADPSDELVANMRWSQLLTLDSELASGSNTEEIHVSMDSGNVDWMDSETPLDNEDWVRARTSEYGDTIVLIAFTRAPKELQQALHNGRELEAVRAEAMTQGQSCRLPSGASIFTYPTQHDSVKAFASSRELKPHHVILNQAFLPLLLDEIQRIPSKANVRPCSLEPTMLLDSDNSDCLCVVEGTFISMTRRFASDHRQQQTVSEPCRKRAHACRPRD